MTWFEIEQIARYIQELESCLDDWKLNNMEMRAKLSDLERISAKLETMDSRCRQERGDPVLRRAVSDLHEHIRTCNRSLRERLIT